MKVISFRQAERDWFHTDPARADYVGDALASAKRNELKRWANAVAVWARAFVKRSEILTRARERVTDAEKRRAYSRQIEIADRALELWCTEIAIVADELLNALAERLTREYGADAEALAEWIRNGDARRVVIASAFER